MKAPWLLRLSVRDPFSGDDIIRLSLKPISRYFIMRSGSVRNESGAHANWHLRKPVTGFPSIALLCQRGSRRRVGLVTRLLEIQRCHKSGGPITQTGEGRENKNSAVETRRFEEREVRSGAVATDWKCSSPVFGAIWLRARLFDGVRVRLRPELRDRSTGPKPVGATPQSDRPDPCGSPARSG